MPGCNNSKMHAVVSAELLFAAAFRRLSPDVEETVALTLSVWSGG
jgi:hypothetical protein